MKARTQIVTRVFKNYSKMELERYIVSYSRRSEADFAFIILKKLIDERIGSYPLEDIEKAGGMLSHYDNTLESIKNEFPIVKPILENAQNQATFFEPIRDGFEILYNAFIRSGCSFSSCGLFTWGDSLWDAVSVVGSDHFDKQNVRTLINCLWKKGHLSYTSPKFMEDHSVKVISKLYEADSDNTLYGYLYDNHWYLLFLDKGQYNVIDIRGKFLRNKNHFIEGHPQQEKEILYLNTYNIKSGIQRVISDPTDSGKICIAINDLLVQKQGNVTGKDYLEINRSLFVDFQHFKGFVEHILSLTKEDSLAVEYRISDTYLISEEIRPISSKPYFSFNRLAEGSEYQLIISAKKHDDYCAQATVEHDKWALIKCMTLTMVAFLAFNTARDAFFDENGKTTISADSIYDLVLSGLGTAHDMFFDENIGTMVADSLYEFLLGHDSSFRSEL